jgi:uncharacterized protein (TIRG00374 family)
MVRMRGLILGVAVSVVAVYWLVSTTDLRQVGAHLAQARVEWLLPALLVLAVQGWIRAERWAWLLRPRFGESIRAGRVVDAMLVGYFVNAVVPGRLGEVARSIVVARREAVAFAGVAATVVVERAIDLMALAVLLAVALVPSARDWSVAAMLGGLALLAVLGLGRRATVLGRLVPRRAPARVATGVREFLHAIETMPTRAVAGAAVLSAAAWLGDTILVLLVSRALDLDIPVTAAVVIGLGGALGTALPAAPGYLGTYELGAVTLGALSGVPRETVLPVAILTHVVGVTGLAAAGALATGRVGGVLRFDRLRRADLLRASAER